MRQTATATYSLAQQPSSRLTRKQKSFTLLNQTVSWLTTTLGFIASWNSRHDFSKQIKDMSWWGNTKKCMRWRQSNWRYRFGSMFLQSALCLNCRGTIYNTINSSISVLLRLISVKILWVMSKFKCYSAFEITVNVSSNHAAFIFHKLRKQKTVKSL